MTTQKIGLIVGCGHSTARATLREKSDVELVTAAQSGSREAFDRLVEHYQSSLLRFFRQRLGNARETQPEDLTQETLLQAYTHIHDLRHPDRFRPWLYSIARTTLLMNLRHKHQRSHTSLDEVPEELLTSSSLELDASEVEAIIHRELIRTILGTLKAPIRKAFIMHYLDGHTYAEIADHERITPAAAQSRAYRAKQQLRRRLEPLKNVGSY